MARLRLSVHEKRKICELREQYRNESLNAFSERVRETLQLPRLSKQTLSDIIKQTAVLSRVPKIYIGKKKQVVSHVAQLDGILGEWVADMESSNLPNTGAIIVLVAHAAVMALGIPDDKCPQFSAGWLGAFKKRHNLFSQRLYGEAISVDANAVEEGRALMHQATVGYSRCDVFNMDETGFFYCQAPRHTIGTKNGTGIKQDKTRVTMCVGANADGSEKFPLLIIGTARKPQAFAGHDMPQELGIAYTNSKKGRMNGMIFRGWALRLNADMERRGRKILLFVDNVSSHGDKDLSLSNLYIVMLSPSTTAILQPMDHGIIRDLKRKVMDKKALNAIIRHYQGEPNPYKVDLYTA